MPFTCPNCSTTHEKVPGYVAQEVLTQRLKAKTEEVTRLTQRVASLEASGKEASALQAELDAARTELTQIREAATVKEAFNAHNIGDDAELRDSFRAIYTSQMTTFEGDEKPSFAEWLGSDDAKNHVLLRSHYAAPAQAAPAADPAAPAAPPRPKPANPNATVAPTPAASSQGVTAAELMGVFQSPAYKALPFDQRKALRAQWQQDLAAGNMTTLPDIPSPS